MEVVTILKVDSLYPGLSRGAPTYHKDYMEFQKTGDRTSIDLKLTKGWHTLTVDDVLIRVPSNYTGNIDIVVRENGTGLSVLTEIDGSYMAEFFTEGDSAISIGLKGDTVGVMVPTTLAGVNIYEGGISDAEVRLAPTKLKETKKVDLEGWYLEGEFPLEASGHIAQDHIILANTKSKGVQPFRINNVQKKKRTVEFEANHLVFDMRKYTIDTIHMEDTGVSNALTRIQEGTDRPNPFKLSATKVNTRTHTFEPQTMLEAVGFVIEHWGGRLEIDGLKMILREEMGEDRGETISYGKNLEDIRVWENWDGVVTKLMPLGPDNLKLPETYVTSDIQYKNEYAGIAEFQFSDAITEDDSEEARLDDIRQQAIRYLEKAQYPKIAMQVTSNINQDLELWDHIIVKHPSISGNLPTEGTVTEEEIDGLGVPIRVLSYEYDVIAKRVTKIEYGDYSVGIKSFIKGPLEEFEKEVDGKFIDHEKNLKDQTDLIKNLNKNGHVVIEDDIIYVVDTLPKEKAKNVIQIGLGGIGFSETGIDGTFKTAWDIEGNFNADFISAGTIEGSLIKTESIQAEHLSIDAKQVLMNFAKGGGTNLIRNSVGYGGIKYPWKISPVGLYNAGELSDPSKWVHGSIEKGEVPNSDTSVMTSVYIDANIDANQQLSFHLDDGYEVMFVWYDVVGYRVGESPWMGLPGTITPPYGGADQMRAMVRKAGSKDELAMSRSPLYLKGGEVEATQTTWALRHISKHSISFTEGGGSEISQSVEMPPGRMYTLSATARKDTLDGELIMLFQYTDELGIEYSHISDSIPKGQVGEKDLRIEIPYSEKTIYGDVIIRAVPSNSKDEHSEITDIMLASGNTTYWQSAAGETYTTDVQFDADGVRVIRRDPDTGQPIGETIMSPYEFAGYYNNEKIFTLNGDITDVKGLNIQELGLYIQPIKMVQNQSGSGSLDIVWTGKE